MKSYEIQAARLPQALTRLRAPASRPSTSPRKKRCTSTREHGAMFSAAKPGRRPILRSGHCTLRAVPARQGVVRTPLGASHDVSAPVPGSWRPRIWSAASAGSSRRLAPMAETSDQASRLGPSAMLLCDGTRRKALRRRRDSSTGKQCWVMRSPSLLRVKAFARLARAASLSTKTKRSTPRRTGYTRGSG